MKNLNNMDLRLAGGLALRSDMKSIINELVDRLNDFYTLVMNAGEPEIFSKALKSYIDVHNQLLCIFNFLYACQIFSKRTYDKYYGDLDAMYILVDITANNMNLCMDEFWLMNES